MSTITIDVGTDMITVRVTLTANEIMKVQFFVKKICANRPSTFF